MRDPYREPPAAPTTAGGDGNAAPWELRTWQSERSCPVCAIPLFAASKDNYRIDACGKCGGSWMMHGDVRKMIDTSNRTPIDLARMADSVPASAPAQSGKARECPECRSVLVPETLGGAEIDVCDNHGTWFDQSELERVAIALLKDYGVARRITDAEAERRARETESQTSVSLQNVAIGVATLGLALVGAAISVPVRHDAFGREIEIDPLGREVVKPPRAT